VEAGPALRRLAASRGLFDAGAANRAAGVACIALQLNAPSASIYASCSRAFMRGLYWSPEALGSEPSNFRAQKPHRRGLRGRPGWLIDKPHRFSCELVTFLAIERKSRLEASTRVATIRKDLRRLTSRSTGLLIENAVFPKYPR
jgi:hypothetical protein